jgi:V8-like Glu-specific endopeptidase
VILRDFARMAGRVPSASRLARAVLNALAKPRRTDLLHRLIASHGDPMNTHRLFANAALLAAIAHSLGCTAEMDSEWADDAEATDDVEATREAEAPLVNGTTTTDFAPVVRISWSRSYSCGLFNLETCTETHYCTATAIAADLLVTASHCVKDGTTKAGNVKVSTAHGANSGASGKSSSYLIMSDELYNTVSADDDGQYWYRDFTFIKFGAGTFSSYYGTTYAGSEATGTTVTKVGFGGNSTKEYATKTINSTYSYDNGDYRLAYTSRSGAYGENGDSGGPLLKWNSTTSNYEVLGVVYGTGYAGSTLYDVHPIFTSAMETNILAPLRDSLPAYCVEAFKDANYSGFPWSICNETGLDWQLDGFSDPFIVRDHWDYGNWNDEMSSLKLPTTNTVLTLYVDSKQGGSSVTFQNLFSFGNGSSVPSMGNEGFNDTISSFSIVSGGSGTTTDWHLEITRHGKCIDTTGTPGVGVNVYQWSCVSSTTNQIFRLESVGNNYRIKHTATGLCLGAENGGTTSGTKVELQTCDGSNKQLYSMSSNASTSSVRDFKMVNVNSNLCVDLLDGSSSNGAALHLWTCSNTNTNQNFALKKLM